MREFGSDIRAALQNQDHTNRSRQTRIPVDTPYTKHLSDRARPLTLQGQVEDRQVGLLTVGHPYLSRRQYAATFSSIMHKPEERSLPARCDKMARPKSTSSSF